MISTVDKAPTGFIPRLESARGVAALVVAAFHVAQAPWSTNQPLLAAGIESSGPVWGTASRVYDGLVHGRGAVFFFFALSGFVLACSLDRDRSVLGTAAWHFLIRRIARLYPAVGFAILLFASVYWLTGAVLSLPIYYTPISLLRNALLLNTEIDGVMWSLQAELIAIPLIFALVMLERRCGNLPVLAVAALLVGLLFKPSWHRWGGNAVVLVYCFVFGLLVRSVGRTVVSRLGSSTASLTLIASVFGLCAARLLLSPGSSWTIIVEAWTAASIVAVLAYGHEVRAARSLDAGVFRFYGRISFSFYLLHPLTLIVAWHVPDQLKLLLDAGVPNVVLALALFLITTAVITPLAWLSWRFAEQPGIALGRRILCAAPRVPPGVTAMFFSSSFIFRSRVYETPRKNLAFFAPPAPNWTRAIPAPLNSNV